MVVKLNVVQFTVAVFGVELQHTDPFSILKMDAVCSSRNIDTPKD
jgi:hypothetical protein